MEKRRVVIALAVVFLVGLAWGAQAFATDCGEPLSAPTYQVGDKWTWRNDKGVTWSNSVVQVEGNVTQIGWPNGEIAFLDKDWIVRQVKPKDGEPVAQQGAKYTTIGQKTLDFPLQIGKTWEYTFVSQTSTGLGNVTNAYKVAACEEVPTPAGKFQAFRLEGYTKGPRATGNFNLWYAPQVKQYVKRQNDGSKIWEFPGSARDYELNSFKVQ
jgi:hypothetical protein